MAPHQARLRNGTALATRHGFEDLKVWRNQSPGRPIAREDSDLRLERRTIIEGSGVNRKGVGVAEHATENETAAAGAEVADRVSAACGLRCERASRASKANGGT